MLKVVVDTNQFVSSLISKKGASARLIHAWQNYQFTLIINKHIFEEIKRVLYYPRIIQSFNLTEKEIETFIAFIRKRAVILSDTPEVNVVQDDPDDNHVLACAVKSKADYIVSGDEHLLSIKEFEGIPILEVKDFLKLLVPNN